MAYKRQTGHLISALPVSRYTPSTPPVTGLCLPGLARSMGLSDPRGDVGYRRS